MDFTYFVPDLFSFVEPLLKKVLLAFAPLIVVALLPMLFVIATLIAWSTTGFAP
jgi:hypothetical protein